MLRAVACLVVAAFAAGCAKPAGPQVAGPLAIDIPELCTRCVEVLDCRGGDRRIVYVLDEKSAWAQVATIWDYFAQFFRPKTEDFRTATAYTLAATGDTVVSATPDLQARLDVWARRVELPDAVVEQRTGDWQALDGRALGRCTLLPRGRDRELAASLAGTQ